MLLLHPILIPGAVSLSWILVVGMARCAWSTKTAPQVICLYSFISLHFFCQQCISMLNKKGY